jgi:hypothetical protein
MKVFCPFLVKICVVVEKDGVGSIWMGGCELPDLENGVETI